MFRWLNASNVSMGSMRLMRKATKELLGTNLTSEAAPFTFSLKSGGLEIRAAPYVYIPNLTEKIVQLLEKNESYG